MSALNVTQDEADLLLTSLKMFADVQRNSGSVSDDVVTLIAKLVTAPVAVVEEVVAEEVSAKKSKKTNG
jgi:NADH:ubiquinone oxidoreductase subunit E